MPDTAIDTAPPAADPLGVLLAEYHELATRIDVVLPELIREYTSIHYPDAAEMVLEGDPWDFTLVGLRSADGSVAPDSVEAVEDGELSYLARDVAVDAVRPSESGDVWLLALRSS